MLRFTTIEMPQQWKSQRPNSDLLQFITKISSGLILHVKPFPKPMKAGRPLRNSEELPNLPDLPAQKRRRVQQIPAKDVQFDQIAHFPEMVDGSQRQKCQVCNGFTQYKCLKCHNFACLRIWTCRHLNFTLCLSWTKNITKTMTEIFNSSLNSGTKGTSENCYCILSIYAASVFCRKTQKSLFQS